MMNNLFIYLIISFTFATDFIHVDLIKQVNAVERWYDLFNRIRCYEMTDILGSPSVMVADDFIITSSTSENYTSCESLNFTLNTIRTFQDQNPLAIIIMLMYHDNITNGPGKVFFKRTLLSPNNTGIWDTLVNVPSFTSFIINHGDLDDDNTTKFDFYSLPRYQTLWFSFYGIGPRDFSVSTYRENSMFWITLNNNTIASTPVVNPLFQNASLTVPNYDYFIRSIDVDNMLKFNMSNWTDAIISQPYMLVSTKTYNMAWSVQMTCFHNTPPPTMTTETPTINMVVITSAPSFAPFINSSSSPSSLKNDTINTPQEESKAPIVVPIVGIFMLSITILCIVLCITKSRERSKRKQMDENFINGLRGHEDRVNISSDGGMSSENENINDSITTEKHYTGDDIFTPVHLEKVENPLKKDESFFEVGAQWLNTNILSKSTNNAVIIHNDDEK
jgi:hypothetical protein